MQRGLISTIIFSLAPFWSLSNATAMASERAPKTACSLDQKNLAALKGAAEADVDAHAKRVQEMVDSIFSFAEPGFQEFRTSEYVTGILESNGFTIQRGVAEIPTAWTATWGQGGPLIALGADIDALLGLSQVPGSSHQTPQIPQAPGHGEGHSAGMAVVVNAALAAKKVMEECGIPGRLMIWPGVAEELLGSKAYYVRAGLFNGVDATLFAHVDKYFGTGWGALNNNGMVSVEYQFHGKTAHAAGSPWEGRSALDAVELMDVAWNYRREHLPVTQRSHYVISNGGGQPNVVPDQAAVWYYFRDKSLEGVRSLYTTGNQIAEAAALATGTTVTRRVLGHAAPNHFNKALAIALHANMERVGLPRWSDDDKAFAAAVQRDNGLRSLPLPTKVAPLAAPEDRHPFLDGGSDDIGDIMWTVPTAIMYYPANIPATRNHHAIAAMAMATPIAHKGAAVGAKAMAMTVLDLMVSPDLRQSAWDYFRNVQTRDIKYEPIITKDDHPAIDLNRATMQIFRPQMEGLYYDPKKYPSYLEQLGIEYHKAQ